MPADRAKLLELPRAEQQAADRDAKIIEVARKANGPNAPSIKELFPNAVARVTQYGMGVEVVSCFVAPNRTPEATIELDPVTWKPGEPLLELRDVEVFEVQYFDGTGSEVGKRSLHPALISEEFLDGRADRERIDYICSTSGSSSFAVRLGKTEIISTRVPIATYCVGGGQRKKVTSTL